MRSTENYRETPLPARQSKTVRQGPSCERARSSAPSGQRPSFAHADFRVGESLDLAQAVGDAHGQLAELLVTVTEDFERDFFGPHLFFLLEINKGWAQFVGLRAHALDDVVHRAA